LTYQVEIMTCCSMISRDPTRQDMEDHSRHIRIFFSDFFFSELCDKSQNDDLLN